MRNSKLGEVVDWANVSVEHPVVLLQTGGLNGAHLENASIVDEHIQPTEVADGRVEDVFIIFFIGHVTYESTKKLNKRFEHIWNKIFTVETISAKNKQFENYVCTILFLFGCV